jgi:hypothetical protein
MFLMAKVKRFIEQHHDNFDPFVLCPFPKWQGHPWEEVLEKHPSYVEWLVSGEGPPMSEELYDHLVFLLED